MALNWVEDLVSHLYQLRGYLVIQNEDLPMLNRAHSDIDIIAIKDSEVIHAECQSWWVPNKDDAKELKRLKVRFESAPERIKEKYAFLRNGFSFKRVFVTSGKPKRGTGHGPWDRLARFCSQNEIELIEINAIITDLVSELSRTYPSPYRVGREEGIARFLLHLIHNNFVVCQTSREKGETPNTQLQRDAGKRRA